MNIPLRRHMKRRESACMEVHIPYLSAMPQYLIYRRQNGRKEVIGQKGLQGLRDEGMTLIKQICVN